MTSATTFLSFRVLSVLPSLSALGGASHVRRFIGGAETKRVRHDIILLVFKNVLQYYDFHFIRVFSNHCPVYEWFARTVTLLRYPLC